MRLDVGVILAAASAAGGVAGCIDEPAAIGPGVYSAMTGAEVATIGVPGPADIPFGEALVTYSRELSDLHAAEGEHADARIRWQVQQLAAILERMPAAAAQPALRRAAGLMRAAEEPEPAPPLEATKRALAIAATALLQLVPQAYGRIAEIGARARSFAGAVSAIDTSADPPDRSGIILALIRAERLLAAMYAANVAPFPR